MPVGKVPPEVLERAVFSRLGQRRADVLVPARLGEDSAVVDFGEQVCVVTTDPITGASHRAGWLGVHVACNDLAANGAEPIGVLVTLLFPEGSDEQRVAAVMEEIDQAARELGIEVLGGHSEVTAGIPDLLLMTTALGRGPRRGFVTSAGARPGDAVLVTKSAAIEGTAILAHDFEGLLRQHLPFDAIRRAQDFFRQISVVPEGRAAAELGATAMHDATEGGIVGALYELAEASQVGLEVWPERIPVREETRQVCGVFGADPLRLISSGSMLITAPDGSTLAAGLAQRGIAVSVVGRVTNGSRWLVHTDRTEELRPPARDELWRVREQASLMDAANAP